MHVILDQTGYDCPPAEVIDVRIGPGQSKDLFVRADSQDPIAPNCERLDDGEVFIHGQDVAAREHPIGNRRRRFVGYRFGRLAAPNENTETQSGCRKSWIGRHVVPLVSGVAVVLEYLSSNGTVK